MAYRNYERTTKSRLARHNAASRLAEQVEERTTVYSVREIAQLLCHDPEWVYQAIRRGQLRCMRSGPGSSIRVEPLEFANFIRRLQGIDEVEAA
jgi:hypothetical protein